MEEFFQYLKPAAGAIVCFFIGQIVASFRHKRMMRVALSRVLHPRELKRRLLICDAKMKRGTSRLASLCPPKWKDPSRDLEDLRQLYIRTKDGDVTVMLTRWGEQASKIGEVQRLLSQGKREEAAKELMIVTSAVGADERSPL
jgi:hypothetical protein